jgi:hypothetical protein
VQLDASAARSPGRVDTSGNFDNFQQEVEKQVNAVGMPRDATSILQLLAWTVRYVISYDAM